LTTALARSRPEDLLRAAALLGATADDLGTAIGACRRSAGVRWVSRANERYQERLTGLATDLVQVQTAFDTACEALLGYARALSYAQPLAEQAARLAAAGELARVPDLTWEAEQTEQSAAARLLVVLDELVARAPRTGGWTAAQHDLADFATGLDDAVKGIGSSLASVVRSLPGVGSGSERSAARSEVAQTAEDSVQPWKQVQDLVDAIEDGHGWRAGGQVAGAALFRFRGVRGKTVDLFGHHDDLPVGVMGALARGVRLAPDEVLDATMLERLRRDFVAALVAFEHVPAPTLDELLDGSLDLLHHEAGKGHTLLKHIGRDVDFLRRRQLLEPRRDGSLKPISSFGTLDLAERAIQGIVRAHAARVRGWLAHPVGDLGLVGGVPVRLGRLIDVAPRPQEPTRVVVRLTPVDDGLHIRTAYLDGDD
jgi:hypothetical protein